MAALTPFVPPKNMAIVNDKNLVGGAIDYANNKIEQMKQHVRYSIWLPNVFWEGPPPYYGLDALMKEKLVNNPHPLHVKLKQCT